MQEKIELALLIKETKPVLVEEELNLVLLTKNGYNEEALHEIELFTKMVGQQNYNILNQNLSETLMNINFHVLKNWLSEKTVNPSGLNLGTARLLLNLSANVKYNDYRCSGLMFTDDKSTGNHSLNNLVRSYLISHVLDYRTKSLPTFDDSEEKRCLPYIKNLIDFINDLTDINVINCYFQADGALLLSRLFGFFSLNELAKLESYFDELMHFNTIYQNDNLDEKQIQRLKEVINEIETMLMIAFHDKVNEHLVRTR